MPLTAKNIKIIPFDMSAKVHSDKSVFTPKLVPQHVKDETDESLQS